MAFTIEKQAISELQQLMQKLQQNQARLNAFLEQLPMSDAEILKPKLNPKDKDSLEPNLELYQITEETMKIGYDVHEIFKQMKTTLILAEAKITTSSDMKSTVRQQILAEVNASVEDTNGCIALCAKLWTYRLDIAKKMFNHREMLNEGLIALQCTNKQCLFEARSKVFGLLQRLITLHQLWEANKDVLMENENLKLMY